ncbi:MAG: CotH kinase family protein [Polyangiales bacterium]
MKRAWVAVGAMLSVGLGLGCADPMETSDAPDAPLARLAREETPRPEGWEDASHGKRAAADYAHVFADGVQRIDVVMTAETYAAMLEDLLQRIGGPGTRNGRSPLAVAACAEKEENARCAFLDVEGSCTPAGPALACEADDQIGPLDMVPGDPTMVPVTVRHGGRQWNHVGMRLKGNSSLTAPFRSGGRKLPLRLDFDAFEGAHPEIDDQRFHGFEKLTFASGYSDPSLIREKLAADFLREAGAPVARAALYRVYVDVGLGPVYWGVYTLIEDPGDRMLAAQFDDDSGNLYKPDGPGAEFVRFDAKSFEKKNHEKEADFSDVERAFAALHAPRDDAAAWRAGLEAALDVDTFLRQLAATRAIDHWDAYGVNAHNFYLYGDPAHAGRLVWISWDHNLILQGGRGRSSVLLGGGTTARWPLLHYVLGDAVYQERFRAIYAELLAGAFAKARFDARATALSEQVAPYVVGPEGERAPFTNLWNAQSFTSALPSLIRAADARRTQIETGLAPPPPPPPVEPPAEVQPPVDVPTPEAP